MYDHALRVAALHDGVLERPHRERRLHALIDRVPHDPVRTDILDRAEVELAFTRFVLRDVHEPELVRRVGGEHVTRSAVLVDDGAEVVVDGWAGAPALAALLPERAPPPIRGRDPPRRPIRHGFARITGLVGEEPDFTHPIGVVIVVGR